MFRRIVLNKLQSALVQLLILLLVGLVDVGRAIVCYKCDSLALEGCAMSLNSTELPIADCSTSTQCVMSIVDAVTYRGCSNDTPTTDATYYKRCAENLCNDGVYPPGRLKCYQCAGGAECADQSSGKPHPCRWHHERDECYTEVLSDLSATYRGCASDTNHTAQSDSSIAYCDINGCNGLAALTTRQCAQCDSMAMPGCKTNLFEAGATKCNVTQYSICETRSRLAEAQACFVYHNLDRVVRGCVDSMPPDIAADVEHVSVCGTDGSLCNTNCMAQQRCVTCDTALSATCHNNASDYAVSICGSAEMSSCYACQYDSWQVRRGCGPPPSSSELPARDRCFECDGSAESKCNAKPFTRCYQCSSAVNRNCANWDRPGFDVAIEECAHPGARCVMAVLENGTTVRGCESEQLRCDEVAVGGHAACDTCDGNFCNTGQFPANALRCHQCENCPFVRDLDALPCVPQLSVVAGASEACFEYHSALGTMRGCRSDSSQYFACVHQNTYTATAGCRVCHTDGCNNGSLATAIAADLRCYTCERDDFSCQDDQRVVGGALQRCRADESCFVTRHLDGTTTRGCTDNEHRTLSYSVTQLWERSSYCSHAHGCNSSPTRAQFCVRCQTVISRENEHVNATDACASAAYHLKPVLCRSGIDGCYIDITGSQVARGCSSELTNEQYEQCQLNGNCYLCQGQQCNAITIFPNIFYTPIYHSSSKNNSATLSYSSDYMLVVFLSIAITYICTCLHISTYVCTYICIYVCHPKQTTQWC